MSQVIVNGVMPIGTRYPFVRCSKDDGGYAVQVWLSGKTEGPPDGEYRYPVALAAADVVNAAVYRTVAEKV